MGLYNGAIKFEFSLSSPWELFFSFCSYKTQLFIMALRGGIVQVLVTKFQGSCLKS